MLTSLKPALQPSSSSCPIQNLIIVKTKYMYIISELTRNERKFPVTPIGMNIGKKKCLRISPAKNYDLYCKQIILTKISSLCTEVTKHSLKHLIHIQHGFCDNF